MAGAVDFRRTGRRPPVWSAVASCKIEVEDATAGIVIMDGLIGNCLSLFEIRYCDDGDVRYLVCGQDVPRQAYLDAFELAKHDRFDPGDPSFEARVMRLDAEEKPLATKVRPVAECD
jgi:hypothetical protein